MKCSGLVPNTFLLTAIICIYAIHTVLQFFVSLHNVLHLYFKDVDTIYLTQDTRELNLQDFIHLENRYNLTGYITMPDHILDYTTLFFLHKPYNRKL